MNNDEWDDDEEMSNEEVQAAIQMAVGELLNIASIAADLQATDEAAEEIYSMCDLVAEYHGIERARIEVTENSDGSFTSRLKGEGSTHTEAPARTSSIPGSIRTGGKLKFRVIDKDSAGDLDSDVHPDD
jgi:hypothetical protein